MRTRPFSNIAMMWSPFSAVDSTAEHTGNEGTRVAWSAPFLLLLFAQEITMPNGSANVRRIVELARSVSGTLDLATVLDHVTAAITAVRPGVACSIRLRDEVAGGYRLVGVSGVPETEMAAVIPHGRGLTHAVVEAAGPLLFE